MHTDNLKSAPQHVAIIMDGNGRWAQARGLDRTMGHRAGADTVKKITEAAVRRGIKWLTLYTFSSENWNRPQYEVAALMGLIVERLEEEVFVRNDVRFMVIGDMERLPQEVTAPLRHCMERTAGARSMTMVLALSYSGRDELAMAARSLARKVKEGLADPEKIDAETLGRELYTCNMPDPDLMIRTGGECRLSNFLLWQCAYTELYFTPVMWPDFDEKELDKALEDFSARQRRFGKTGAQVQDEARMQDGAQVQKEQEM